MTSDATSPEQGIPAPALPPDPAAFPTTPPFVRTKTQIEIPYHTVARIIVILGLIWLIDRLFSVILTFIVALFLTAALSPAVTWLQHRGMKRGLAVSVTMLAFIGTFALLLFLLVQPLIDEGRDFAENLPTYIEDVGGEFGTDVPDIYSRIQNAAEGVSPSTLSGPIDSVLSVGQSVVSGVSNTLLVLVMTAYLLADGRRIYNWSVRYLPDRHEAKVRRTIPEVGSVVSGYVVGQLATSLAFGVFTFAVLAIMDVPQALFLALLAAIFDAVPLIGVLIATIPAVLLALTVSPTAAIVVLLAYTVYQQFENYVLAPRVYKGTLQISSFAVLIAVLIGAQLLGVIGALLALPTAAAVPVIERIWIQEPREARGSSGQPAVDPGNDAPVQASTWPENPPGGHE
jgi:predicted PurR-regulated permease PerM